MNSFAKFACVAAFAAASAGASSASATSIFLQDGGIYNPGTAGGYYASAFKFSANYGGTEANPTFDMWGFCIDLYHTISVGINYQAALDLAYHVEPLVHDASGNGTGVALTPFQIFRMNGLAGLGYRLIKNGDPDLSNKLAGVQAAIWSVEYPSNSITSTGAVETYRQQYVELSKTLQGKAFVIYRDGYANQGFIIGVPEPSTWVVMIAGFGLAGAALRRRRALAAA